MPGLTEGDGIPADIAMIYAGVRSEMLASVPEAYRKWAADSPTFAQEVIIELDRVIMNDATEADRLQQVGAQFIMDQTAKENSGGWNRTTDTRLMKPLLRP